MAWFNTDARKAILLLKLNVIALLRKFEFSGEHNECIDKQ